MKMINIGCGSTNHPDWINLDVAPINPDVISVNITDGLPFSAEFSDVCYSSHVLEHLNKIEAFNLVEECFRILKHGGTIRLAVPDLEMLVREYLRVLDGVTSGKIHYEVQYDWLMLELYDQTVRSRSGGDMLNFLKNVNESERSYILSRIGDEAARIWQPQPRLPYYSRFLAFIKRTTFKSFIKMFREKAAGFLIYFIAGKATFNAYQQGLFRNGGEIHKWMYDRYSLKRLLDQAGFIDIKTCAATESRIPRFEKYDLDVQGGVVRKPDSIYIEATKP